MPLTWVTAPDTRTPEMPFLALAEYVVYTPSNQLGLWLACAVGESAKAFCLLLAQINRRSFHV